MIDLKAFINGEIREEDLPLAQNKGRHIEGLLFHNDDWFAVGKDGLSGKEIGAEQRRLREKWYNKSSSQLLKEQQ